MFHSQGPTFLELAQQALSSTEHGYDLLAPKFDYTPYRTPDAVLEVIANELKIFAPIESLLDVCCGTGAALQWLEPLCHERMVGIDISKRMLDVAAETTTVRNGGPRLELVRSDALNMPFGGEFDMAVCFGAIGHFLPKDQPRFIERIHQVLKPGGRFVFVTSTVLSIWSRSYWLCRGFNAAMHVRNLLVKPPFIMFYLTFPLDEAVQKLEACGFVVEVSYPYTEAKQKRLAMVVATRS